MAERKISTPIVIASASAMIAIGIAAWIGAMGPSETAREQAERAARMSVEVDDRTPEGAAESFYDCWRRRRWPQALSVSEGAARNAVLEKISRDDAIDPQERVLAERAWDALAHAPLRLAIVQAERLPGSKLQIDAIAEYTLVNQPYRRRVQMVVVEHAQHWRVERMQLGERLTELPEILRGAGE